MNSIVRASSIPIRNRAQFYSFNFFAFLIVGVMLSSCNSERKDELSMNQKRLQSQVRNICGQANLQYEKRVIDLSSSARADEKLTIPISEADNEKLCVLEDELYYALAYDYLDPDLREYFSVKQVEDTVIATRLAGKDNVVPLVSQKILYHKQDSTIMYVSAKIVKDNWLYHSEVLTEAIFDSTGQYEEHVLEVSTGVFSVSNPFNGKIAGKLVELKE